MLAPLFATLFAACGDDQPAPAGYTGPVMSFKQGSRFEYETWRTDAETGVRQDTSARRSVQTVVSADTSAYARIHVTLLSDSLFNAFVDSGAFLGLGDSIYIRQKEGTGEIDRYKSFIPPVDNPILDFSELTRAWVLDARIDNSRAGWLVGATAGDFGGSFGIPGISGIRVAVSDSAIGSASETLG